MDKEIEHNMIRRRIVRAPVARFFTLTAIRTCSKVFAIPRLRFPLLSIQSINAGFKETHHDAR